MFHRAAAPSTELLGPDLDQHHHDIEAACLALLAASLSESPRDLGRQWKEIEHQLLDHLMAEEHFVLPGFASDEPEIAHELRRQHTALRERAFEIGVLIDLRLVRIGQLRAFIAQLRAHARAEAGSLYRWGDRCLPRDQRQQMRAWLVQTV